MNQTGSFPAGNVGEGHIRSKSLQRWGALIGGGALAIYGLTRRSTFGSVLAAGGATLALVGANRRARDRELSTWSSVLVNCTPQEVYQFWRDFENLPRFMFHVESVSVVNSKHSRWVTIGPLGVRFKWDAEIEVDRENDFLSWRALPGSDLQVDGWVAFRPAPANRGTYITAALTFHPANAPARSMVTGLLQKRANFLMRQDLHRLQQLIETGEIPTTEGQTHGPRAMLTAAARMMDPSRAIRGEAKLKDVLEAKRRIA